VLVAGAFGGVGRSPAFTAKDRGARVIAGVLRKQLAAAQSLGVDHVVALDNEDALSALTPWTQSPTLFAARAWNGFWER
jgi:NADPH:quinone reductase-like Zn-dependent oxidoreductase